MDQPAAVAVLVCLVIAARSVAGSWLHPSVVFAAAWTLFLAVPTALGTLDPAPTASALIVMMVAGAVLTAGVTVRPAEQVRLRVVGSKAVRRLVIVGSLAGAASGLVTQHANGIPLSRAWDLNSLLTGAVQVTVLRYNGGLRTPALATVLLALSYGAALAAPYAAATATGLKAKALLVAPAASGAFYALATTAKAGFVIAASITAGAWVAVHLVTEGGRPRFRPRNLLWGVTILGALSVAFIYLTAARVRGLSGSLASQAISRKVSVYSGGGIPAFEQWLHHGHSGVWFGAQSLAGISQFLLLNPSMGHAYADVAQIGPGVETNVYTILRPLSEDFTLPGAILVQVLLCLLAAEGARRAVTRQSVGWSLVTSIWLGVVLFSSATSTLSFVNVVFGLILGGVLVSRGVRFAPQSGGSADADQRDLPAARPHEAAVDEHFVSA